MTFYRLDAYYQALLTEISEDLLQVSVEAVVLAQKELPSELNPTVVFSLADHINFALRRLKEYKVLKVHFSHDVAALYPRETEVAEKILSLFNERLGLDLPKSEVTSLAMHMITSQVESSSNSENQDIEEWLEIITQMIEKSLNLVIERDEFNYQRFQAHLRYFLKQTRKGEHLIDGNQEILTALKSSQPQIYQVAKTIMDFLSLSRQIKTSDDELLYLVIHINRLYEKNKEKRDDR